MAAHTYLLAPTGAKSAAQFATDETALEAEGDIATATVEGVTTPQAGAATKGTDIGSGFAGLMKVTMAADADSTAGVVASNTTVSSGLDNVTDPVTFNAVSGAVFNGLTLPFVIICESEQLLVTAISTNAITVSRGYDGTTPASHANTTAFKQYIDEATTQFEINDESLFAVGDIIKIETGGTERLLVVAKDATNDILTVRRGYEGTTPAVIADAANIFDVKGWNQLVAALASAGSAYRILGNAGEDDGSQGAT
jgi:hypothetical protein